MNLREAYQRAVTETSPNIDRYDRTFEIMHGRLPSASERDMIRRRCIWYENESPSPLSERQRE